LVEQWTFNPLVEGSNPSRPTKYAPPFLLTEFLKSRRQGLSPNSLKFHRDYLNLAYRVIGVNVTGREIAQFLDELPCSYGGKHAYFRTLRVFYNWLYSPRSGYNLNPENNPILYIEAPKVGKKILPSLSQEQVDYLIEKAECIRDKAIISLFVDSGLRLTELTGINPHNIDWQSRLIKVVCKGNKEGLAPFQDRTEALIREWLSRYPANGRLWDMNAWGIEMMLRRLRVKTGLPCNPHTFRRTYISSIFLSPRFLLHYPQTLFFHPGETP